MMAVSGRFVLLGSASGKYALFRLFAYVFGLLRSRFISSLHRKDVTAEVVSGK